MTTARTPMTATRLTTWGKALEFGKASLDAFEEETGEIPTAENDGGWSESAWACHWHELRDAGAIDEDYDRCFELWKDGFWSREHEHEEDDYLDNL